MLRSPPSQARRYQGCGIPALKKLRGQDEGRTGRTRWGSRFEPPGAIFWSSLQRQPLGRVLSHPLASASVSVWCKIIYSKDLYWAPAMYQALFWTQRRSQVTQQTALSLLLGAGQPWAPDHLHLGMLSQARASADYVRILSHFLGSWVPDLSLCLSYQL